jgi:hypothetical protein
MASLRLSFRKPISSFSSSRFFPTSGGPLPRHSFQRLQSSQATAAVAQLGSSVNELEKESLDDVFGLLRSKAVSWNEPGSAQFDFRRPFPFSSPLLILYRLLHWTSI